jgi:hypothetical protein
LPGYLEQLIQDQGEDRASNRDSHDVGLVRVSGFQALHFFVLSVAGRAELTSLGLFPGGELQRVVHPPTTGR